MSISNLQCDMLSHCVMFAIRRSQHCEVEKRRRERMNRYMAELAQMIPACTAVPRRLDKLSILKMTVDHMKNLRGDPHASSGFLSDEELKQLVVEVGVAYQHAMLCGMTGRCCLDMYDHMLLVFVVVIIVLAIVSMTR